MDDLVFFVFWGSFFFFFFFTYTPPPFFLHQLPHIMTGVRGRRSKIAFFSRFDLPSGVYRVIYHDRN